MSRIAIIPGDGIGIDVTREAVKVMATIQEQGIPLEMVEFDYGADKYLEIGITLPVEEIANFRANFDTIYIDTVGDSRVPGRGCRMGTVTVGKFICDALNG